jgi:hypothetical protein
MRPSNSSIRNGIIFFLALKGTILQKQDECALLGQDPQGITNYFALA